MAAELYYALLPGPNGRAPSESGYWDEDVLDSIDQETFTGYPLVPAAFFGAEYTQPAQVGTGGYIRTGKTPDESPVVDLS